MLGWVANCQTRQCHKGKGLLSFWWMESGFLANGLLSRIPLLHGAEIGLKVKLCLQHCLLATDIPIGSIFPWEIQMLSYDQSIWYSLGKTCCFFLNHQMNSLAIKLFLKIASISLTLCYMFCLIYANTIQGLFKEANQRPIQSKKTLNAGSN